MNKARAILAVLVSVGLAITIVAVARPPGVLSSSGSSGGDETENLLEATLIGIPTPGLELRGVPGGGAAWVVAKGEAKLEANGQLEVEVEGLLITGTGTSLDGTTGPVTGVKASLTCEGPGVVATTGVEPLSAAGNAKIEETIPLPKSCVGPIILVRIGSVSAGAPSSLVGRWIATTGFGRAMPAGAFEATPFEFDPNGLGIVFAKWVERIGLPDSNGGDNFGLLLSKNGNTTALAAAGANIKGAAGITLTELRFDTRSGGHCGAGAPRFNVVVDVSTDPMTVTPKLFFFGCSHGAKAPVPGVTPAEGWARVSFADKDASPADGMTVWPGFGKAKVMSIKIIFDEGTDTGTDFSGMVILDNIDINGTLITRGPVEGG